MAFEISMAVLVAVIIGLTQVAKMAGLPSKYAPLLAIIFGVLGTLSLSLFSVTANTIIAGLVVGLMSMGLYSGTKTTISE